MMKMVLCIGFGIANLVCMFMNLEGEKMGVGRWSTLFSAFAAGVSFTAALWVS